MNTVFMGKTEYSLGPQEPQRNSKPASLEILSESSQSSLSGRYSDKARTKSQGVKELRNWELENYSMVPPDLWSAEP